MSEVISMGASAEMLERLAAGVREMAPWPADVALVAVGGADWDGAAPSLGSPARLVLVVEHGADAARLRALLAQPRVVGVIADAAEPARFASALADLLPLVVGGESGAEERALAGATPPGFSPALVAVWRRALPTFAARVAVLEDAVCHLLAGSLDEELRARAEQEAHKLAGAMGTFGMPEGSALARRIEAALAAEPAAALTPEAAAEIFPLTRALRRLLRSAAGG